MKNARNEAEISNKTNEFNKWKTTSEVKIRVFLCVSTNGEPREASFKEPIGSAKRGKDSNA